MFKEVVVSIWFESSSCLPQFTCAKTEGIGASGVQTGISTESMRSAEEGDLRKTERLSDQHSWATFRIMCTFEMLRTSGKRFLMTGVSARRKRRSSDLIQNPITCNIRVMGFYTSLPSTLSCIQNYFCFFNLYTKL